MSDLEAERIKRRDALNYLLKSGALFELNRTVLHPIGMAINVVIDDDPEIGPFQIGLIDSRNDPEGFVFVEIDDAKEKKESFEKERIKKVEMRKKVIDCDEFGVQTIESCTHKLRLENTQTSSKKNR